MQVIDSLKIIKWIVLTDHRHINYKSLDQTFQVRGKFKISLKHYKILIEHFVYKYQGTNL